MRNFLITLFAAVMLSACQSERETSVSAPAEQAPTVGSASAPDEATRIADELHRHIPALASDEFMGRQPGTRREELTVSYLAGAVQEIQLLHHMGRSLASSRDFPRWTPGVEFEAAREASLASGDE
jgi:hypothetical protein